MGPRYTAAATEDGPIQSNRHLDLAQTSKKWGGRYTTIANRPAGIYLSSFTLHVLLLLAHVILLIAWRFDLTHGTVVTLGEASTLLSQSIIVGSQVLITLYTAGLLLLTQRLALRRALAQPQTLAGLHDLSSAWAGLGGACMALMGQLSVWTGAAQGVVLVILYLGGLAILHVTTPTLFTLAPFNQYATLSIATSTPTTFASFGPALTWNNIDLTQPAMALPILQQYNGSTFLNPAGLDENIMYGSVKDFQNPEQVRIALEEAGLSGTFSGNLTTVGNAVVNATVFDVRCASVNEVSITSIGNDSWSIVTEVGNVTIPVLTHDVLHIARVACNTSFDYSIHPYSILVYASLHVYDASNKTGSEINVTMWSDNSSQQYPEPGNLTLMGCTLNANLTTAQVNAQNGSLSQPRPSSPPHGTWKAWTAPTYTPNWYTKAWGALWNVNTTGNWPAVLCEDETVDCTQTYMTLLQQYVNQRLDLFTSSKGSDDELGGPLYLSDVEDAMSAATAAVYWAASNAAVPPENARWSVPYYGGAVDGTSNVTMYEVRNRLELSIVPLAVGLGVSALLLLITVLVTSPSRDAIAVDSLGLLQTMWLLGRRPDALDRIAGLENPEPVSLRKRALFEVELADGGLKMRSSRSEEGLDGGSES